MDSPRFTPEFKEESILHITERGYSVAEACGHLGVLADSLTSGYRPSNPMAVNSMPGIHRKPEAKSWRSVTAETYRRRTGVLKKAARYL